MLMEWYHYALSGLILVILIGSYQGYQVFAQMESMTIEGLDPYVNSVFNVSVDVDGVSRASHGIFRTVMTLFEKETGNEILAVPDYLRSGINTIQINMIPDRNSKPFIVGITYILQIQHVNIISQHEFTPKQFSETELSEGHDYTVVLSDGVGITDQSLEKEIQKG